MFTTARLGGVRIDRVVGIALALTGLLIGVQASRAQAAGVAHSASQRVALIPQAGPLPAQGVNGIMPTSSHVTGRSTESFAQFSFTNVPLSAVTSADLAQFDTVVLNQVDGASLSAAQKAALSQFVANGGKLLIHDADETKNNDYSWVLGGPYTTRVGQGCNNCGSSSGGSRITTNDGLISSNASDASYVNLAELYHFTDQGDSNLLVSTDPRWFALAVGTNGRGESGAQLAFAGVNQGLVVYNGFDTDFIKTTPTDPWRCNDQALRFQCPPPPAAQPTVDWLAQMWYSELAQGWGTSGTSGGTGSGGTGGSGSGGSSGRPPALPKTTPVVSVGQGLAARAAGLPSNRVCVAHARLRLRLKRLMHRPHVRIVQVDVYVNLKHVLREKRPFTNATLKALPRRGTFTVTVIGTTKRAFHLIAKQQYRGC